METNPINKRLQVAQKSCNILVLVRNVLAKFNGQPLDFYIPKVADMVSARNCLTSFQELHIFPNVSQFHKQERYNKWDMRSMRNKPRSDVVLIMTKTYSYPHFMQGASELFLHLCLIYNAEI